jgi:RNA polymerase sigma-70 factor (ECF subfamily)
MRAAVATFTGMDEISRLVRERRAALAALARAEGVSPEDAVDCVQEALCTFLARAEHLPAGQWHASLAMMVRNAARNRRRRRYLARPHVALGELPSDAPGSDERLARAQDQLRLAACMSELCEIQRAVVTLRMLEEQPGEDVGRALGLSAAHVAVLLHRAKAALRACMTSP